MLNPQAVIWNHAFGFIRTSLLHCALELGIADIIHRHGQPISLSQLGVSLSTPCPNTDNLRRMMRYFEHMGLFTINSKDGEEDKYCLTPTSKLLLRSEDSNLVPLLQLHHVEKLVYLLKTKPSEVMHSCLGGENSTFLDDMHEEGHWDFVSKDPDYNKLFNEALACHAKLVTRALIDGCGDIFRELGSLVDVGGGNGTALQAISKAFPHIKCTVLELPHVVQTVPDFIGVDRVAGDMFSFVPYADAVMLMGVLHDWGDEKCLKILRKCKEAVPEKGGKVIIVDIVSGMEEGSEFNPARFAFDMEMMPVGGKERSEKEWKELLLSSGFSQYKITPVKTLPSVIEAFP